MRESYQFVKDTLHGLQPNGKKGRSVTNGNVQECTVTDSIGDFPYIFSVVRLSLAGSSWTLPVGNVDRFAYCFVPDSPSYYLGSWTLLGYVGPFIQHTLNVRECWNACVLGLKYLSVVGGTDFFLLMSTFL